MRFKFVFLMLSFLLISILGTTFFLSYLNESERQDLLDRRLQNYLARLSDIDFTDKSDEEVEAADELSRDLKNAGIVWVWQKGAVKRSGGARTFAALVEELCSVPGFSSGKDSQAYIRCLKQPKSKEQPSILVASILAKGTSHFLWLHSSITIFWALSY
ncbi:MAG: hypothetical protein ACLGGX_07795 [Bdellovibrionia bacterium]